MLKPTLVVLSDCSTELLEQTVLCRISPVLCYEDQYFTWILVVVGWLIAAFIAYLQYKKHKDANNRAQHNEWVKELKDKLTSLEDLALNFWFISSSEEQNHMYFISATREIKEITTIAQDLKSFSNITYPGAFFSILRKELTNDKCIAEKPLKTNHIKFKKINDALVELRKIYSRKGR